MDAIGNQWYKSEMVTSGPSASPIWNIDLSAPPRIMVIGTAVHGERLLSEQYNSDFWVLLLFHYHGEVLVDGHQLAVQPGWAGVFPPGATLHIRYRGRSTHRYVHLALPAGRADKDQPIAAVHDLGRNFAAVDQAFEQAIRASAVTPERASMILWDLLWQLAERTPRMVNVEATAGVRHPALAKAEELVELHLAEAVRVSALAAEVGLSARQLGNLFHAAHQLSPVAYIRQRRIERARLLLTRTSASVAQIAADVGIPDLQAFNKAVHRALGSGPRAVRAHG